MDRRLLACLANLALGLLIASAAATPLAASAAANLSPLSPTSLASTASTDGATTHQGLPHRTDGVASLDGLASRGPTPRALAVESEYDAVRVPDDQALSPRGQITVEMWIKRQHATGCGSLLSKGRERGYWLGVCDGRLRLTIAGVSADAGNQLPEGRWTHVAASFDGTTASFYQNGVLDRAVRLAAALPAGGPDDLVIGADVALGSFFPGWIDHVRLWSIARSDGEVRDSMLATLPAQAGLVAQWPLNGDARDLVGGHDGRAGSGSFSYDGVLPRDLTVPLTASQVAVDGKCDAVEYGSAERVALEGVEPLTAYVQSTATQLYVCIADLPRTNQSNAALYIYLDRNASRDTRAQPGDYRFVLKPAVNPIVEEADGQGGWKAVTLAPTSWEAGRVATNERWSSELRVARTLLEPPRDPADPFTVGLAIAHNGWRVAGEEDVWPTGAVGSNPQTWALATLANTSGLAPRYDFAGRVERLGKDGVPEGIAGATVQLWLEEDSGLRLADTTTTDLGGLYHLGFQGYPPDRFLVIEQDPRGTISVSADAGLGGGVAGSNILTYPIDPDQPAASERFTGGRFLDRLGPREPMALEQHYLVVYSAPVEEEDLAALLNARREEGFQVTAISTQALARVGPGRDLAEKIHLWLESYWERVEPEPVYALLIGRGDTIPFRDIGWLGNDHRDPAHGDYYPAWPTDWYYADVDSDWDADGDGFYGEFLSCRPGDTYPALDEDVDCPEAGSLAREGPYGALRGTADDFKAEIAVGRLPVGEPGEVRRALAAMLATQQSGAAQRRRALLAGSLWNFEGDSWSELRRAKVGGNEPLADPWLGATWDGTQPFGHDTAEAFEQGVAPVLSGLVTDLARLYESTSPGGDPALSPTRYTPTMVLAPETFRLQWQRGLGLVAAAGRGSADGLFGASWATDWDGNRRIDQPARPTTCVDQPMANGQVGPPCWELVPYRFMDSGLAELAATPPYVIANAGRTGGVAWQWQGMDSAGGVVGLEYGPASVASRLLGRGRVAGWIGALGPVEPGSLDDFQAKLTDHFVQRTERLGDAYQVAVAGVAQGAPYDLRSYGTVLLGDPAALYWGNPADARGAWPQDGADWRASGAAAFGGPRVPERAWLMRDPAFGGPVAIGADGELIAAGVGAAIRVSGGGVVISRTSLGSASVTSRFAPALTQKTAAIAAGGSLHLVDLDFRTRTEVPLPGGAQVTGPPRVASDGAVYVPASTGMFRVDGAGRPKQISTDPVRGAAAVRRDGEIVWSTAGRRVEGYRLSPTGQATLRQIFSRDVGDLTAPAVSAAGTVYVGAADGRVYAQPEEGAAWQLEAGAAVRVRPTIGPTGEVYAVNSRGQVLAFAAERNSLLWSVRFSGNLPASPVVDGTHVYVVVDQSLYALNLANGKVAWAADLGGPTDERSSPVIGADRTLYVVRTDQTLVAVREAGWLAAPSSVVLEVSAQSAAVRWRDNSQDETGFRVELCDQDNLCKEAGSVAANAVRLDLGRLSWPVGRPLYARVQAVGRASEAVAAGAMDSMAVTDSTGVSGSTATTDSTAITGSTGATDPTAATGSMAKRPERPEGPDAGRLAPLAGIANSDLASSGQQVLPPTARPAATSALTAEASSADAITLRWRFDADAGQLAGFTVLRQDGLGWRPIAYLGADEHVLVDRNLAAGTRYAYQVVATNEAGSGDPATVGATTRALDRRAPTDLQTLVQRSGVLLQWRAGGAPETGVVVERLDPGTAEYHAIAMLDAGTTRFVDRAELVAGTYAYRVKSVDTDKNAESPAISIILRYVPGIGPSRAYLPVTFRRR